MNWIVLFFAGLCEVCFTYCIGRSKDIVGTSSWVWISGFVFSYVLSMILLDMATQTLPIGTAYPVWMGIGTVRAVLVGVFFLDEPVTFLSMFFIFTLVVSVVVLI